MDERIDLTQNRDFQDPRQPRLSRIIQSHIDDMISTIDKNKRIVCDDNGKISIQAFLDYDYEHECPCCGRKGFYPWTCCECDYETNKLHRKLFEKEEIRSVF